MVKNGKIYCANASNEIDFQIEGIPLTHQCLGTFMVEEYRKRKRKLEQIYLLKNF